jgi:hypothetical protein
MLEAFFSSFIEDTNIHLVGLLLIDLEGGDLRPWVDIKVSKARWNDCGLSSSSIVAELEE